MSRTSWDTSLRERKADWHDPAMAVAVSWLLMHHVMRTKMMQAFLVQQTIAVGFEALLCHVNAPCDVNDGDAGLP